MLQARNWALVIVGSCFLLSATPAAAANCEGWNTRAFFESATLKAVTDCLQAGADPDARNEKGFTPLHDAAVFSKTPAVVKALLAAGADLNTRSKGGETPLHMAAWFSKTPAVVVLLLDAGADPVVKNNEGETPWDYAKANTAIKGTKPYWRLNDARFK